jgi:membrane fusion protein (multidrug efflux system)
LRPLSLPCLLLGSLCLFGIACEGGGGGPPEGGAEEGPEAPGPERRVPVEIAEVELADVADHLMTSGTLESEAQADIVPEASGVITQVLVEEGQSVRAGEVLAIIANPSLDANADRASIELQRTKDSAKEMRELHARGATSDRELREAEKALQAAETNFQEARRSRGFTRITSPIAGTVAVNDVRVGEVASAAKRAFQVVDLAKLRVVVQLPEKDLPRIRVGQSVSLSGAYDESATASGVVQRVSPVVDAATGTVRVTIGVNPEGSALKPGQFAKVRLEVDRHPNVPSFPRRGLLYDEGEPVVWKVIEAKAPETPTEGEPEEGAKKEEGPGFFDELLAKLQGAEDQPAEGDNTEEDKDPWEGIPRRGVEKVRIKVGYIDTDRVEILEGLSPGEQIVTVGNTNLRTEVLVRLPGDPEPPPPEKEEDGDDPGGKSGKGGKGKGRRGPR